MAAQEPHVYILGGGPAGLSLASELAARKIRFTVFEAADQLGGLATTLKWGTNGSHDLGPHKIFTTDPVLNNKVHALLPKESWLTREKTSSIYMKGKYLPYPPSPFSLLGVYGLLPFCKMVFDYGITLIKNFFRKQNAKTFEEDLILRMGRSLYEALFRPTALKLWGEPQEIDAKLSQGRVQTPSVLEVLGRLLKIKKTSQFEALTFSYPKGGLQQIWNAIQTRAENGGNFQLQSAVAEIAVSGHRVQELKIKSLKTNTESKIELGQNDFVFSTLPLGKLPIYIKGGLSAEFKELTESTVLLNDLLLVFLKVDVPSLIKESWIFIPDLEIPFHRLSEQESFDPSMTPDGSIVCCEIMSNSIRPMAKKTDEELIQLSLDGISKLGYQNFKVRDSKVLRLPKSYPVYKTGFEPKLARILNELDQFENFKTVGRQGAFNYIGTLDAMDIGYGAAKVFAEKIRPETWQQERARTAHYPVLD